MTSVAQEEAADVGRSAVAASGQVTETAAQQAKDVAAEAGRQARDLLQEALEQARGQAREGQDKVVRGLHGLGEELRHMAEKADGSSVAVDLVRQASERTDHVASWLERREPGELLEEVRSFARRRPGAFLLGAGLAGALVGRLTKGVVAAQQGRKSDGDASHVRVSPDATVPGGLDAPAGFPPDPGPPPGWAPPPPPYPAGYGQQPPPPPGWAPPPPPYPAGYGQQPPPPEWSPTGGEFGTGYRAPEPPTQWSAPPLAPGEHPLPGETDLPPQGQVRP